MKSRWMTSLILVGSIFATGLMLPVPVAYAMPMTFVGNLAGANEVPAVPSPGTGLAMVVLDPTAQTIQVNVTLSGLTSNERAARIHCCAPLGTNAGVATTVPAFRGSGNYSSVVFDLTQPTIYNPAFVTLEGGTISQAEAALVAGIEDGMTYLNIHTTNNLGGEIRGQLLLCVSTVAGLGLVRWRHREPS
jgi:CHRD domain-containing protein